MSAVKEEKKIETKETFWTTTEKETSRELYGTEILIENGSLDEVMTVSYTHLTLPTKRIV